LFVGFWLPLLSNTLFVGFWLPLLANALFVGFWLPLLANALFVGLWLPLCYLQTFVEKVAYNVFRMHIAKPTLKRGKIIQSNRKYQLEPVSLTFSKFLYLSRNRRDIADRLAKIFDVWPYNRNGLAP
jgi:hypothetical protein